MFEFSHIPSEQEFSEFLASKEKAETSFGGRVVKCTPIALCAAMILTKIYREKDILVGEETDGTTEVYVPSINTYIYAMPKRERMDRMDKERIEKIMSEGKQIIAFSVDPKGYMDKLIK